MRSLLIVFSLITTSMAFGQFGVNEGKDSCYFKYDKNDKRIHDNRYAEWECGKIAGVIDCNEELRYDKESNIVYREAKDNVNLAGSNKPFTGTCEMCYMNGSLQRRVTFVNGKEDGQDTTLYMSGCPQVIRSFVQGAEHGTWYYYYDSTEYLAWEMNYIMGEKHGKQIYFAKNGDTTLWENYQNGLLHGIKRDYYPDSKIYKEISYSNGVFDGPFKVYNGYGDIIQDLNYSMGKKDKESKYYYDDGTLMRTENWNKGVKEGEFKIFFYDGSIQQSENYKKGRKEGWFEHFYHDGTPKRRALYEKDELIEEHRYDEHGRETYSFGTPTGDQMEDDAAPDSGEKKKKKKKKRGE